MKPFNFPSTAVICGLCGLLWALPIVAQQNPRPDPPGPLNDAVAENPIWYNDVTQTPWYSHAAIRRDLNLNERQYELLNRQYNDLWNQYNVQLSTISRTETPLQRRERIDQMNNRFYNDLGRAVDTIITDPLARQRFNQLQWQYRHYGAFVDPYVQQQLNLTEAQKRRLDTENRRWNLQMDDWNRAYANNSSEVLRRYNTSRSEYSEGMRKILTPQQQQIWSEQIGQPYEFAPDAYFQSGSVTTAKPILK